MSENKKKMFKRWGKRNLAENLRNALSTREKMRIK